ncbi:hypothetical protein TELCIR_02358 [Teladorsagia circumcincta]|uniref:Aminoglycoside phosphotransferase domain-containing protein n=1 Tax=Teladorsagia circumcincta TaxID=45464 RepID=A0A2G9V0U3_TELCI|nr:hypothetical protein TELCIR_02358 [Teladorsagia circumcincta]
MEGVPKQFIVKISSQLPMLECHGLDETGHFNSEGFAKKFEEDVKMLHNHEAHLYELLKKYDRKDIPTPKVYFTRHYTDESPLKGYIIMEYIADGVPYHIFDNLKPESMLQPLKAIAKLQATAMRFSAEEKAPFQFNFLGLFSKFYSKEAIDSLFIMMRSLGDGKLTDKVDKLEGILEKILDLDRMTKLSASLAKRLPVEEVIPIE